MQDQQESKTKSTESKSSGPKKGRPKGAKNVERAEPVWMHVPVCAKCGGQLIRRGTNPVRISHVTTYRNGVAVTRIELIRKQCVDCKQVRNVLEAYE